MRIDKYLWCTRYYKTRTIATEACKKGAVKINKETAKPSREIYPGDEIQVRRDQVHYSLKVLEIPASRMAAKLVNLYRIDTTPPEALENQALLKLAQDHYRQRGEGRPTKKDRRDLDEFTEGTDD
jgi:ribosome-associated heat shock protein Hsp15